LPDSYHSGPKSLQPVFQNGNLLEGWGFSDWGGTVELKNTEHPYPEEQYSIKASLSNWGGISFLKDNFDTTPFNYVEFMVYGSITLGNDLRIGATNQKDNSYIYINVNNYSNCTIPSAWTKVSVPLSQILADHTTIKSITFQIGHVGPATFWLDMVVFTT